MELFSCQGIRIGERLRDRKSQSMKILAIGSAGFVNGYPWHRCRLAGNAWIGDPFVEHNEPMRFRQ